MNRNESKSVAAGEWEGWGWRGRWGESATSSAKLYAHEISNSSTALQLSRGDDSAQAKKKVLEHAKKNNTETPTHKHFTLGVGSAHPWPGFGLNRHLRASMSWRWWWCWLCWRGNPRSQVSAAQHAWPKVTLVGKYRERSGEKCCRHSTTLSTFISPPLSLSSQLCLFSTLHRHEVKWRKACT